MKAAMNRMGMEIGECRLPLYQMDERAFSALEAVLHKHGLID